MIYRYVSSEGFKFFHEKLALVPEYHALMMVRNGDKLMELIVKCYTIFSPYTDIYDETEREEKVSVEMFGEKVSLLKTKVFKDAKKRYIYDNDDIDLKQQQNTEFAIETLLADRHALMTAKKRETDDLDRIERIGKSLKLLYDEKESLIDHIHGRVQKGDFSEGKRIGGKKLSYKANKLSLPK